ncbi:MULTISPECIES: hypothetical protein [unclassified Aureimonas]|uniref:hypothetical protein n=1 Tax=unclassified Aureimonas TaxID=2615206 RepID=UPI0006F46B08|nr:MULTISPECIES: hypothetical protein [unclassified Aureimonas]KQT63981.1 hypothetical protein ASG62_02890 [Aureimonas sp. Leaf427]KQT81174.1 hypothetical protein ASG54_00160 [Aureimonas sp. Leaf460]
MKIARLITWNVKRFARRRPHPAPQGHGSRRIVAMVDAGFSYDVIRRELGVRNAEIDGALRQHEEGERSFPLHP